MYRYNASIIFEYDNDYKYYSVKVINDDKDVLFEVPNSVNKIVINGDDLYSDFPKEEDIPAEFLQAITDNFFGN